MPIYARENRRHAHFAEICGKCGSVRNNMRGDRYIRVKLTCDGSCFRAGVLLRVADWSRTCRAASDVTPTSWARSTRTSRTSSATSSRGTVGASPGARYRSLSCRSSPARCSGSACSTSATSPTSRTSTRPSTVPPSRTDRPCAGSSVRTPRRERSIRTRYDAIFRRKKSSYYYCFMYKR